MELKRRGQITTVTLACGTKTTISSSDEWILEEFPVWAMTGSRSKYVCCDRAVKTEFSIIRERLYLHRIIVFGRELQKSGGWSVDHIDRNRLNNTRENLRRCRLQQNQANVGPRGKNKYKGINLVTDRPLLKPYRSYITIKNKQKLIGYFKTAEEAARAYDAAAKELHGDFAFLNFPQNAT